jgi:hypothetical protein
MRHLSKKIYHTMLGFACVDPDGERGEAKIKLILQTAKHLQTNMRTFTATFSRKHMQRDAMHCPWQENFEGKQATTPLHFLINNKHATIESLRMVCNTWPRAVHIRGDEHDRTKTILMDLTYSCSDEDEIERLQAFSNVLFEAAEKTKEGARGLVLASDKVNVGVDDYFEAWEENNEEQTVLHVATTYYERPGSVLPIFLKWWPEALKHLGESWENGGDYPFHNIFRDASYESLVKSIEAFVQYSSLDALAAGLLYDNINDGYGFDLFIQALESSEVKNMTQRCQPLQVHERWQFYLVNSVDHLLQKRDAHGRSLLHYITAYDAIDDDLEGWRRSHIACKMREEYEEAGQEFPYQRPSWDNHEDDDATGLAILLWWKKRQKQKLAKVGEIAQWILRKNKSLALSVDINGLNPFQYAVSVGKEWHSGLDVVARLVPGWAQPLGNGSLCPFAIAACSCDDLDTVFELLRFDASVLKTTRDEVVMTKSQNNQGRSCYGKERSRCYREK